MNEKANTPSKRRHSISTETDDETPQKRRSLPSPPSSPVQSDIINLVESPSTETKTTKTPTSLHARRLSNTVLHNKNIQKRFEEAWNDIESTPSISQSSKSMESKSQQTKIVEKTHELKVEKILEQNTIEQSIQQSRSSIANPIQRIELQLPIAKSKAMPSIPYEIVEIIRIFETWRTILRLFDPDAEFSILYMDEGIDIINTELIKLYTNNTYVIKNSTVTHINPNIYNMSYIEFLINRSVKRPEYFGSIWISVENVNDAITAIQVTFASKSLLRGSIFGITVKLPANSKIPEQEIENQMINSAKTQSYSVTFLDNRKLEKTYSSFWKME